MLHARHSAAEAYYRSFGRLCQGTIGPLLATVGRGRRGRRLLDVGTGPGTLAAEAAKVGYDVTGVDPDPSMISLAHRVSSTVPVISAALPRLPFTAESFAVVTANFAINHTPDPGAAVEELRRVLIPGGVVAITIWPSATSAIHRMWALVMSAAGVEQLPHHHLPPHLDFPRTAEGLHTLCRQAGFKSADVSAVGWDFSIRPDHLWLGVEAGAAPIGEVYRSRTASQRAAARTAYADFADAHAVDGRLTFPTRALLAVCTQSDSPPGDRGGETIASEALRS